MFKLIFFRHDVRNGNHSPGNGSLDLRTGAELGERGAVGEFREVAVVNVGHVQLDDRAVPHEILCL